MGIYTAFERHRIEHPVLTQHASAAGLWCRAVFTGSSSPARSHLIVDHPSSFAFGWATDFLFAGSSALLLSIAGLWPNFWGLVCIALVPFLYRVTRSSATAALRLGSLFGVSYFGVLLATELYADPTTALFTLALGTVVYAVMAWGLAIIHRKVGVYPVVTALLWLAAEVALRAVGLGSGLLSEFDTQSGLLYKISVLFGALTLAFIIVVINGVLLCAVEKAIATLGTLTLRYPTCRPVWFVHTAPALVGQRLYLATSERGPPR